MDNKIYIAVLPIMGRSWVSVNYFQSHPVYYIKSLEDRVDDIVLFNTKEGKWQEDGAGVTRVSEAIGNAIQEYQLK